MRRPALLLLTLASVLAAPAASAANVDGCEDLPPPPHAPDAAATASAPLAEAWVNLTGISAKTVHFRIVTDNGTVQPLRLELRTVEKDANYGVTSRTSDKRLVLSAPDGDACGRLDAYADGFWDFTFTEARIRVRAPAALSLTLEAWAV